MRLRCGIAQRKRVTRFFASLFPSNAGPSVAVRGSWTAFVPLNCRQCAAENSFLPLWRTQFDKRMPPSGGGYARRGALPVVRPSVKFKVRTGAGRLFRLVAHTPRREQRPSFVAAGSSDRCDRFGNSTGRTSRIERAPIRHTISPGAFKNATTETAVLAS